MFAVHTDWLEFPVVIEYMMTVRLPSKGPVVAFETMSV